MGKTLATLGEQKCHGGVQGFYRHESTSTGTEMRFAVYQPPQAQKAKVPALYYLSGLTCTEETAAIKAGAQAHASRHGLMLVMPDTSPRGAGIEGEDDDWDLGTGAGFYLDATEAPWAKNYRMYSYVTEELCTLINANFPARPGANGIFGHSMGGHGALTIALKNPAVYRSVSAFAPICAPMEVPWGQKAFSAYLGDDRSNWLVHDACELVRRGPYPERILVDQGTADQFLAEQLRPELFQQACRGAGQALELRLQDGYDHSYYFIQTFVGDHLAHHAAVLSAV
ncbi:MAG TPA: S-formylglutathione hydrolase [Gammaproteobacteria bacterium]|nr:S-formylglutathione hydrolase [Gammaproteobacteria bacterium]